MKSLSQLRAGAHIHLMGICGTAMASLAGLLKDKGFAITGSDSNPYPPMSTQLESLGIQIMKPYSADNLRKRPDFVIVGNVISASNPEAQELLKQDIPYTSLPVALGEFIIGERESVVISGTHGKTTTTSLMSWVAEEVGKQPGFLIGGIAKNFSKSFRNPNGNWFVIEGDEYDTAYFDKVPKFVHYRPKHVILTSVEFDHADIYKDLDHVKSAFKRLMQLVPSNGTFIWCAEDKNIPSIIDQVKCERVYSYGLAKGDYLARILNSDESGTRFEVLKKGVSLGEFEVNMVGNYNILNCTAVIALADQQSWSLEKVKIALKSFSGVKRRQELLGSPDDVVVIEDFAHHPTAVRETIIAIQNRYRSRKVFSVFEPRSATSRRKVFQKDYVEAFSHAQEVILCEAFDQSKIDHSDRFSSAELVSDLAVHKVKSNVFSSADEIAKYLLEASRPGDLILIMSNGGFDGIYGKVLEGLEKRSSEKAKR
jgi:UDP-N-acetylmuramate: L-alanyl-gamma-D-glutamyl-meso-diaminopimelate ligase